MRAHKQPTLERIAKGAIAGLLGGIVASWAANQFHSLGSKVRDEEQNQEVVKLSARGGRPDTAAAKEQAGATDKPQEDATVIIASHASRSLLGQSLNADQKHVAGVAIHYAFGAVSGAFYGAAAEVIPSVKVMKGLGFGIAIWLAAVEVALPLLKLAEPPWRYPVRMHTYSLISHLIYGSVTEQARRNLRSAL